MRKMTLDELLERYAAGERDFRGLYIYNRSSRYLKGIDLSGIDLRFSWLRSIKS